MLARGTARRCRRRAALVARAAIRNQPSSIATVSGACVLERGLHDIIVPSVQ